MSLQLTLGVGELHTRGIAHRDLNPGNVMLDVEGVVRLIDLGTAYMQGRSEMTPAVGTG